MDGCVLRLEKEMMNECEKTVKTVGDTIREMDNFNLAIWVSMICGQCVMDALSCSGDYRGYNDCEILEKWMDSSVEEAAIYGSPASWYDFCGKYVVEEREGKKDEKTCEHTENMED